MALNPTKTFYPSLSEDGWIPSSLKQADAIMASFLASDYSQSYLFAGRVSSFGYLVARFNSQPELLTAELTRVLQTLLGRYYDGVQVQCTDSTKPENPSRIIISVFAQFQLSDGTVTNLTKLVQVKGSKFQLINDIILNGE